MLFAIGFLTMFLIGGINGAFSASVPVDFALHDTYFVVAHIHYVLFGGSVFGIMAGLYYWFPKMTGRMLNETLGKIQFVLMFIGFNLTFFPMHELGLAGMPRRIADYSSTAGWNDLNLAATIGGFLIAASMLPLLWNIFISLRSGKPAGDDPWEANTLEWATTSPPPPYNFDHLPEIRSERPAVRRTARPAGRALGVDDDDHRQPGTDDATEHSPVEHYAHDSSGGISNPVLGMLLFITSEVMFFAGLFAAYFNVRAQRRGLAAVIPDVVAADPVRPGDPAVRRAGHDPADPELVHLPVRRLGDPTRRPDGVPAEHGRDLRHRHRVPAHAGQSTTGCWATRSTRSPSRPARSGRPTSR